MAFFKLRKAAGEPQAPAPAPESVDALRRRARYRLAGAALLVLAGVIGFPLLFDNQPRPIAVDIPIDIPDKAKVKPLVINPPVESKPVKAAANGPAAPSAAATNPLTAQAGASRVASASVVATAAASEGKAPAKELAVEAKPVPKEVQKEEVIISPSKSAGSPAASKSEDKPADKAAASGRFIVQFGAFSDSARAHEARLKVEKTGLKTYAQVVEGPEGKKFRVRVGPFEKRSDAERAADKIKKLDLPAAILGL
jgi:DedD protein